jgi:hypothetical protein
MGMEAPWYPHFAAYFVLKNEKRLEFEDHASQT